MNENNQFSDASLSCRLHISWTVPIKIKSYEDVVINKRLICGKEKWKTSSK